MRMTWIVLALLAAGCASMQSKSAGEKEEGKEVKVSFSDLPEPVQKTFTDQAGGQKIDKVDKETGKDGATVYEADAKIDGKNYEIVVGPDGKLISKKIDNEEDEKKEGK